MILDYKNDPEYAVKNGIEVNKIYKSELSYIYFNKDIENGSYEGITFKNFPDLYLGDATFTNCIFENCGSIEISRGTLRSCIFEATPIIIGIHTDFYDCTFKNVVTEEAMLSVCSDGEVSGCNFENIRATGEAEDSVICEMIVDRASQVGYLTDCRFKNCTLEDECGSLSICKYKTLFGKQVWLKNIDEDSCSIE